MQGKDQGPINPPFGDQEALRLGRKYSLGVLPTGKECRGKEKVENGIVIIGSRT